MTEASTEKPLLRALRGGALERPPVWLMRQAGRYLPEYRALRASVAGFLELCLTPALAVEATLQPLRRFPLDAAILFSDILVLPHALGQPVAFEEGHGPVLEPLAGPADIDRLRPEEAADRLAPVPATLRLLRPALPEGAALIGFAGAPWTVATYMIEGGSSRSFARSRAWAAAEPASFARLIELLVETTADHLARQAEAGAEVLQIFDSWAGALEGEDLRRWSIEPLTAIIRRLRARCPAVPVILFPRGVGPAYAAYAGTGCDGLSLDSDVALEWARAVLQPRCALQGNLDPQRLVEGGRPMAAAANRILACLADGPFVFNLGHGVLPETPPEHVAALVEQVHGWRGAGRARASAHG